MRTALALVPTLTEHLSIALQRVSEIMRSRLHRRDAIADLSAATRSREGQVLLAGAGPGDPELLTVKTLRAIETADVILHDQLVSREILALAPAHIERIDVGKKGYGRACRQADINALMVAHARAGRRVVRLKAGDPLIFGRIEEETAALKAAGIAHAVIPGISAAQGAASALRIGLTRRHGARRFQAITGHASDGRMPADFDWSGLADPKATTAVYMPKATIATLCRELQLRGLPPSHPAVAVFNATRADQKVVIGSIATLPGRISNADNGAPCIILVGVSSEVCRDGTRACTAVEALGLRAP